MIKSYELRQEVRLGVGVCLHIVSRYAQSKETTRHTDAARAPIIAAYIGIAATR